MAHYTANVKLYWNGTAVNTTSGVLAFGVGDTVPDSTVTRDGLATAGLVTSQPDGGTPTPFTPISREQANAAYKPWGDNGAGVIAIGSSITARSTDQASNSHADSHATYFALASGGQVELTRNAGVGGNTTAQMLARFQTDVVAYAPQAVLIEPGPNDTDAIAQTLPNVTAMIQAARSAGIAVAGLVTTPPSGCQAIATPSNVTLTASASGGTLANGTYAYRVSATTAFGETLTAAEVTVVVTGPTGSVLITWDKVQGAAGYKVYGRTSGAELLIGTVTGAGQLDAACYFTDDGSVTPAGALPGGNTTSGNLPNTATSTKLRTINAVIHRLGRKYGVPVVDNYALLVDPATGYFLVGATGDGTHPTAKSSRLMGQLEWAKLSGRFAAGVPYLAADNSDQINLMSNGLLSGTTFPTSWSRSGSAPHTEALGTDGSIYGNSYTVTTTNWPSGWFTAAPQITTGFSPGDQIALAFMVKASGMDTGGGSVSIGLKQVGGTGASYVTQMLIQSDVSDWTVWQGIGTVRSGATALEFDFNVAGKGTIASVAQITALNLTSLGIA